MPRSRGTVEESSPSAGQLSPRLRLRSPRLDEASKLTELCLRSKACWGYGEEFMRACEVELTVTASTMCPPSYFKLAEIDGRIVGMAQSPSNKKLPNWRNCSSSQAFCAQAPAKRCSIGLRQWPARPAQEGWWSRLTRMRLASINVWAPWTTGSRHPAQYRVVFSQG